MAKEVLVSRARTVKDKKKVNSSVVMISIKMELWCNRYSV